VGNPAFAAPPERLQIGFIPEVIVRGAFLTLWVRSNTQLCGELAARARSLIETYPLRQGESDGMAPISSKVPINFSTHAEFTYAILVWQAERRRKRAERSNCMAITSKEELFTVLQQHHATMRHYGVQQYGLFGSFVRNEPRQNSDVDMLVEFEPGKKTFDNFMNLAFFLEDILGRNVDLVTKESLSPYIGPRILQEAEYVALNT